MPAFYRRDETALAPQSEQVAAATAVNCSFTPAETLRLSCTFRPARCRLTGLGTTLTEL
jgi:hypothetical protein